MTQVLRFRVAGMLRMDLSGVELLIGHLAIAWGLCLIHDPLIFTLPAYRGFVELGMGASRIGWTMLASGLVVLLALAWGRCGARRLSLMSAIAFWAFMTGLFFHGGAVGVTPYLSSVFTAHCLAALLSLRATTLPLRHG